MTAKITQISNDGERNIVAQILDIFLKDAHRTAAQTAEMYRLAELCASYDDKEISQNTKK